MNNLHFFKGIKIFTIGVLWLLSPSLNAQGTAFLAGDNGTGATTWVNTGDIKGVTGILYYSSTVPEGQNPTGTYLQNKNTWTNNVVGDPDFGKIYPRIGFYAIYPGQVSPNDVAGWPAGQTDQKSDVWFQYYVTPSTTSDIHVNKISFSMLALGTGTFSVNAYVSTDPTFATKTQILTKQGISAVSFNDILKSGLDILVKSDQKLYLRVYPWYNNNPTSSAKYIVFKNINFETSGGVVNTSDSKLFSLTANGYYVAGFSSTKTDYNIELPYGTTQVQKLLAVANDPLATISITNASSAPGTSTVVVTAVDKSTTTYTVNFTLPAVAPQIAFPGAEGFGKYTQGGRGGAVYEVTNLLDDGQPGSLRYAVNQSGPRTVVFKVSGTIDLTSNLNISNPHLTIAGQTAPGDGICLKRYSLMLDGAEDVIIRYIRVRFGDETKLAQDAVGGRGAKNIILDHVSASWSIDETMSVYACDNISIQWCLVAESLYNSYHTQDGSSDGSLAVHGFGGIWGSNNSTYHHNLMAHHGSRNPRIGTGIGYFDYRNNVIYNWGYNSTYGGENADATDLTKAYMVINMVNNYYKPGPATKSGIDTRLANPSYRNVKTDYGKWYIAGNVLTGNATITEDNWSGNGIQPQGGSGDYSLFKLTSPWVAMPIIPQTATEAYSSVLDNVGASLKRDAVDTHVIHDTRNGDATYEGTYSSFSGNGVVDKTKKCGIIDSQSDVGGWPVLNSTPAPTDTDHDGMPDAWETAHNLNMNDASDRNTVAANGYTNLENYLNGIEFNYQVGGYTLINLGANSYKVGWSDNYLAESGFKVERSDNNGPFNVIATLAQYSNNYTDNTAPSGLVTYRVIAFNNDNATPDSGSISSNEAANTAVNELSAKNKLSIYPNPVSDMLNATNASDITKYEIYTVNGLLLKKDNNKTDNLSINVSDFAQGIYFFKAYTSSGVEQFKFMKK
ncbi:MAG: T9SS type A sorting domain-containing protein [Paludibacter sp.]|nr:T9SS type A sorting domain-containing protein [Paludibacter sp.]